ncbi:DUF397 domain-containing protein [Actinomadura rupiterrae]|uniref:DUF397 domain-containing protein n=1 Tax=Actinomadura rupiterrae TaxID=559627 RepID=UPI0020A36A67|nr:DUF397 domain-containing protein [Actinomadura rupiterrae]MCP2341546.1 hypothetical protein [Actinomadura rupiterrae]
MTAVTPVWRKSSYSGGNQGDCIELADISSEVGVRDSRNTQGPYLTMTRENLAALTEILKSI